MFESEEREFSHFPLFIDLRNRKVAVIGGGNVAARRVETLIKFGAKVTVIAPQISEKIDELYNLGKIEVIMREYRKSDILNAFIVIIATDNKEVNETATKDARELNILMNRADSKEDCDFFFPAVFSDRHIVGGIISKNGSNHNIVREKSKGIREYLNREETKT
ncbi:precorrin-2 dehydrogenase/sirohydrochlorin ferrochelatase family protein [Acetivibrio clariflavus]|uniref:precorrin-2 dehydrogenase n=1 Tax=Acetivibrio clariflavus (strain DSM 19732 / NBRC 101661 / EBR45) TaxID=720554 RepID=G8LU05_ACECE|nr:NAD(P)-dependent oxidoreductase [Acetivibrio clariflavus]AEV68393.1 siroheme synthase, N-terminal domain protein [Acetivibrio clariflavus DSM 19732]HPU41821.1 NAD(P)-dependent oxidoreductase [Acetivibrio clariflavus]